MVQPHWYYNLQSGAAESPLGYVLQCLLESRLRLGFPSDAPEAEEVNVYLGHLLLVVMTPSYRDACARYVEGTDTEIFHKVERMHETADKFLVYRTNADYRLLRGSVFAAPDAAHTGEQGSTYYHFAAAYNKQIYRRATSLSAVLEHLSGAFHDYETLLRHMRHAYFHLWSGVPSSELQAWLESLDDPPAAPAS